MPRRRLAPTRGVDDQAGVDVAEGTRVACPNCHFEQRLGFHFDNVTFQGNGTNVAVTCPICGLAFDATGSQDGTYSTLGGQLKLIRGLRTSTRLALADAPSAAELARLAEALEAAAQTAAPVADVVAGLQTFPQLEAWVRRNPALAKIVGALLAMVVTALLAKWVAPDPDSPPPPQNLEVEVDQPSEEELQRLINEAIDKKVRESGQPPAP